TRRTGRPHQRILLGPPGGRTRRYEYHLRGRPGFLIGVCVGNGAGISKGKIYRRRTARAPPEKTIKTGKKAYPMNQTQYDFGMIGLGVMGRNFLLNIADHGFSVLGYDKDPQKG